TLGETDTPAGSVPLASETVTEPSRSVTMPASPSSTPAVPQPAAPEAAPAHSVTAETAVVEASAQTQNPGPSAQVIAADAGTDAPYIVLILDDIGNNSELGQRAVSLP